MTSKLKGTIPAKILNRYQNKSPQGERGIGTENCSIDTPNFEGNRMVSASKIAKYIDSIGGFHWGLFGAPLVAELPNGVRRVYDGGHRIEMLKAFYPNIKTFPAVVIKVKDEKEVSRLFHRINGSAASFVSGEVRFINQVLGEETGIEKELRVLELADVVVMDGEDNYVPQHNSNQYKINVTPISDMINEVGEDKTVYALRLYKDTFGQNTPITATGVNITGQIVKALATLSKVYKDWFKVESQREIFEQWLKQAYAYNPSRDNWIFNHLKHDRMEKRHYGTAYGIWQQFNQYCLAKHKKIQPGIKPIEQLYTAYDKAKQSRTPAFKQIA